MTPPKNISPPPTRPYFFSVITDTHTCHYQLKSASFLFFSRLSKNRAKFGILRVIIEIENKMIFKSALEGLGSSIGYLRKYCKLLHQLEIVNHSIHCIIKYNRAFKAGCAHFAMCMFHSQLFNLTCNIHFVKFHLNFAFYFLSCGKNMYGHWGWGYYLNT